MPTLELIAVRKEYPTPTEPLVVLDDCSLVMTGQESVAVTGPSGSGKSTLLNILGTIDRPSSGHVFLDGVDPSELSAADLARFRREKIGFVFQDHNLLPQCSALENVLIPKLAAGTVSQKNHEHAEHLLEQVGLKERMRHRPDELSGGERQRVAIARAWVNQPHLLLADEPTGNLDQATARSVMELIFQLHKQFGALFVLVTHDLTLAATADRHLVLTDHKFI